MLRVDLALQVQLAPRRDCVLLGQLLRALLVLDDLEEPGVREHLTAMPHEPIVDVEAQRPSERIPMCQRM